MGNWIGGDRDGNPERQRRHAAHGARAPERDGAALLPDRGAPARRRAVDLGLLAPVTPEMQRARRALAGPQRAPRGRAVPARVDRHVRAPRRDPAQLTGTEALRHAVAPQDPYASSAELLADLQVIEESLRDHHADALIAPRLAPLKRAVQVFGFHLATVDLRQSSDKHEAVIAEMLKVARVEADYAALDEDARRALPAGLLGDARSLRVRGAD